MLTLLLLAGCSGLKLEDRCTYVREVKTTYHCDAGTIEHYKIAPVQPE